MAIKQQVSYKKQSSQGFTLVELAIVLVIIGLLVTSIVKGTSLTQAAKVNNAITLAQDLTVAINTFKQQYHMLPGDIKIDATSPEIPNVRAECLSGGSNEGDNNGLIDAKESKCVPEILFQAGLAKVEQDNGWAAFKSYYGTARVIAVSKSNVTSGFSPSITHVVEFSNLPCEVVQEMDRKMDNDDLTTGKAIAKASNIVSGTNTCSTGSVVSYYDVAL